MSILHTINKSPFQDTAMNGCLSVCSTQDTVILIEDGVLGGILASPLASTIKELSASGTRFYALKNDVVARGLTEILLPDIRLANYQDFVRFSIECKQIQSWY